MDDLVLAGEFSAGSEDQWRERVATVLKGAPFDKLVTRAADGFDIQPLYPPHHDAAPVPRPDHRSDAPPWDVTQRIDVPDVAQANAQALDDLEGGASGLSLVLPGTVVAGDHGCPAVTRDTLEKVFDRVEVDLIALRLDAGGLGFHLADQLLSLYEARNLNAELCTLDLSLDPIGEFARTGQLTAADDIAKRAAGLFNRVAESGFKGSVLAGDDRGYHMAGATPGQELGLVLATLVAYCRLLEGEGVSPVHAVERLGMVVTADADLFMSIAKFRAARLTWARLIEAMEIDPLPARIDAETSLRMMARRDVHVNMLRVGSAVLGAGIGGADSVTALPMTVACGLPNGFARRMARNTQLILQDESGIGRTWDAAAGSGYIETLSNDLAAAAWACFQDIERHGGMIDALDSGFVGDMIATARVERMARIATRRLGLTGVSEFPDLLEGEADIVDCTLPSDWRSALAEDDASPAFSIDPLPQSRDAEPFEMLRDRADAVAADSGKAAEIFMANIGPVADHTARATWTRNLFAAGGIGFCGGSGYDGAGAAAQAFRDSGAKIACLCASDEIYGALGADTARALKAAGASHVYLAGCPADHVDSLIHAGVDECFRQGDDVVALLDRAQSLLGLVNT